MLPKNIFGNRYNTFSPQIVYASVGMVIFLTLEKYYMTEKKKKRTYNFIVFSPCKKFI